MSDDVLQEILETLFKDLAGQRVYVHTNTYPRIFGTLTLISFDSDGDLSAFRLEDVEIGYAGDDIVKRKIMVIPWEDVNGFSSGEED